MSLLKSSEHNTLNSCDNTKLHFPIFYLDSLSSINITNCQQLLINVKYEPLTVRGIGGEETCRESGRIKDQFDGLRFHLLKSCHFNILGWGGWWTTFNALPCVSMMRSPTLMDELVNHWTSLGLDQRR